MKSVFRALAATLVLHIGVASPLQAEEYEYLLSAGEGTGRLVVSEVDPATGRLTRRHSYDVGKSLTWVRAVKFGDR